MILCPSVRTPLGLGHGRIPQAGPRHVPHEIPPCFCDQVSQKGPERGYGQVPHDAHEACRERMSRHRDRRDEDGRGPYTPARRHPAEEGRVRCRQDIENQHLTSHENTFYVPVQHVRLRRHRTLVDRILRLDCGLRRGDDTTLHPAARTGGQRASPTCSIKRKPRA